MRKVVDSNYLQHPELRDYLSRPTNVVVVTDYASMEAYKDDTLKSIYKSMSILCDFPRQVLILKGTRVVGTLSGRRSHLAERLIWPQQTSEFPIYCRRLKAAEAGNAAFQRQLLDLGKAATEQMDKVLADAASMTEVFADVANTYTAEELRRFRAGGAYTSAMVKKTLDIVTMLAVQTMRMHPSGVKLPARNEMPNTFLFRHALCAQLLVLSWIRDGGQMNVRPEKVRNDLVDVNFATYATYFDGVLTHDKKLTRLHNEARTILKLMKVVTN